jgi:vacuolar-type H+-ATPase subunit H
MIGEIHKSERFIEEIKKCENAINQLVDTASKEEAKKLLNELIFEVRKMDNMYMDMIYNHQIGTIGNEFRERISSIRKNLYATLKIK